MKLTKYSLIILLTSLAFGACNKNKKQKIFDIKASSNDSKESTVINSFEVNDYFEMFIKKNESNTDIVNIDKPQMGSELLRKADKVKLEISGYWANPTAKHGNNLKLEVYPSVFKTGIDNRAIIEQKLKISKEKKYLYFAYLKHLSLNEGLYYYFLKNKNEVIYTGKFMVK